MKENKPLVSIVIPVFNEAEAIQRCIKSILNQDYPQSKIEIIVVDGLSQDGSREVVQRLAEDHPNIRLLDNPSRTTSSGLNIGIKDSRGEVVIILGAHAELKEDYVSQCIKHMREKGVKCVGGRLINVGKGYVQKAVGLAMTSPFGIPTAPHRYLKRESYVDTVAYAAYQKELLEEVGYFDEDLVISEDAELNWRIRKAGYKILFTPDIISYYYPRGSIPKLIKQFFNYGMLRINVIKKHRDALKPLHIVPAVSIIGVLTLVALSFVNINFTLPLIGLGVIYGLLSLIGSLSIAVKQGLKYFPILPIIFLAIHGSFGVGVLVGLFKTRKWGALMPKSVEKALLFLSDFITINSVFLLWGLIRRKLGFFAETDLLNALYLSFIIFVFWFLLFLFFGLYRSWKAQSRLDEFVSLTKAISIGVMIIFLITIDLKKDLRNPFPVSRLLIISYWLLMVILVGAGRVALRTFQRKLLELGIGLRRSLIVGWGKKAWELFDRIGQYPALGYRVIGFVNTKAGEAKGKYKGVGILGDLTDLPQIIDHYKVEEVLIALDGDSRKKIVEVISQCNGLPVSLKILPDLYDIITGQARTNQIYGFPLIEILPELMPAWERKIKRLIDIVVSFLILVIFSPLWILVALAIKIDSRGPVFYKQERVGKDGRIFTIYKFRSMIKGAEELTGPVWADRNDPRITRVGRIIRKLRIDEIPQFFNVLKGDMSLVGPRPERPFFVEKLKEEIPLYARRLKVQPGITGWAQIKYDYGASVEDAKKKLQYDLFYLENMSLRMDMKILLSTIYVMLTGKGQ